MRCHHLGKVVLLYRLGVSPGHGASAATQFSTVILILRYAEHGSGLRWLHTQDHGQLEQAINTVLDRSGMQRPPSYVTKVRDLYLDDASEVSAPRHDLYRVNIATTSALCNLSHWIHHYLN
jgi:hypothetical protein